MKKIISRHFPFSGYKALTIWPFIFIREGMAWAYDEKTDRHEHIHGRQQLEMLIAGILIAIVLFVVDCGWWSLLTLPVFFYWYVIEYLIRLAYYRNSITAYKNISFEREAYANQSNITYLDERKPYSFLKYIRFTK